MKSGMCFSDKAEEIADYLIDNHNKESEAVKAGELCELFHLYKQDLRRLVNYLRSTGLPICSSNKGYWYSEDLSDVNSTIINLISRVSGISRAIKGLQEYKESKEERGG